MVKGTEIGTVTNAEGHYKMVTLKNSALVFSKEGMKTQEIPVGEESEINIQMKKEFDLWKKSAKEQVNKLKHGVSTEDEVYKWLMENR